MALGTVLQSLVKRSATTLGDCKKHLVRWVWELQQQPLMKGSPAMAVRLSNVPGCYSDDYDDRGNMEYMDAVDFLIRAN